MVLFGDDFLLMVKEIVLFFVDMGLFIILRFVL